MATTTATTNEPAAAAVKKQRVQRPNRDEFNAKVTELEKQLREKEKAVEEARNNVKNIQGAGPKSEERKKLHNELDELKKKQADLKNSRNKILTEMRTVEERLKKRIKDLQSAKQKTPFKSVEDIDNHVKKLEREVDSGSLKLVEEKKILAEISSLKKAKKNFTGFSDAQASIDEDRAKVNALKSQLDNFQGKATSERFNEVRAQLDEIKKEQEKDYKNKSALYDNRAKAEKARDEVRNELRKLKDEFYSQRRAYEEQQKADYAARVEREKAEKAAAEKEKKKRDAQEKLEVAAEPAFLSEITTAENLLTYFDPEYKPTTSNNQNGTSTSAVGAKPAKRQVESIPEGAQVVKKTEDAFFAGTGGKKNKKKNKEADNKLSMNLSIVEDLAALNVTVPTSKDDVPNSITKLKEKIDYYKENQERVTAERVERAKAELAKLEDADQTKDTTTTTESQQD